MDRQKQVKQINGSINNATLELENSPDRSIQRINKKFLTSKNDGRGSGIFYSCNRFMGQFTAQSVDDAKLKG